VRVNGPGDRNSDTDAAVHKCLRIGWPSCGFLPRPPCHRDHVPSPQTHPCNNQDTLTHNGTQHSTAQWSDGEPPRKHTVSQRAESSGYVLDSAVTLAAAVRSMLSASRRVQVRRSIPPQTDGRSVQQSSPTRRTHRAKASRQRNERRGAQRHNTRTQRRSAHTDDGSGLAFCLFFFLTLAPVAPPAHRRLNNGEGAANCADPTHATLTTQHQQQWQWIKHACFHLCINFQRLGTSG
jgi:hypothetical protein